MAKKVKTKYVCSNCGAQSTTWIGKCPVCGEWNTYNEEIIELEKTSAGKISKPISKPKLLSEIKSIKEQRIITHNNELDRVLGGGIVPGSLILLGGEPGIGKSTIALQMALNLDIPILYVSGEESEQQIKLRADRITHTENQCFIYSETNLESILRTVDEIKPNIVVIDSIQTVSTEKLESTPGTVSQIRECTAKVQQYAKATNISFIVIGHINKDGNIAGPKILEHIVDTVLQFEGDRNYLYRIIRTIKNRFGSTSEIGIFEMKKNGLIEVKNPSELLLSQNNEEVSGVSIATILEGVRPLLIEVQALVSTAVYGTPQRSSTTFDIRRLNMLLAVLEKRAGFKLSTKDVFLNIAGGLKVTDPATDMAILAAILSSNLDFSISKNICFAGEIGLSGEIRPVSRIEQRISEAEKLGLGKIFISSYTKNLNKDKFKIEIVFVSRVEELVKKLFR